MFSKAVLAVGNYNKQRIGQSLMEDYELILRLLKRYNEIYTIPQKLVYYRIHPGQLTFGMHRYNPEIVKLRNEILNTVIIES
jgi:hypothetical protein